MHLYGFLKVFFWMAVSVTRLTAIEALRDERVHPSEQPLIAKCIQVGGPCSGFLSIKLIFLSLKLTFLRDLHLARVFGYRSEISDHFWHLSLRNGQKCHGGALQRI